jgi:phosphomannomutase
MIDRVASLHGITLHETPVGFKYIGEIMTKEDIIIGGEESNGLTVHRHVPEKDGIIACLLVAEMAARMKKNIKTLLNELEQKTGVFYTARKNFRLTEDKKQKFVTRLKEFKSGKIGSYEVKDLIKIDGYKFMLGEDTWMMTRLSGTEPIVRLYAEAKSKKVMEDILKAGERFILE